MTPLRTEFRIAVLRQRRAMQSIAEDLGVSYNHLILVLDGKRKPSERLDNAITMVIRRTPERIWPTGRQSDS